MIRLLRARVIRCNNRHIRKPRDYRAHFGAFGAVAVASAAEYAENPPVCDLPQGGKNILQSIRRMGIIDNDGIVRIGRNHLDAALDPFCRAQGAQRLLEGNASLHGAEQRAHGIIHRKMAGDAEMHAPDHAIAHQLIFHTVRQIAHVFRRKVGAVLPDGIGGYHASCALYYSGGRGVVKIDNSLLCLLKELVLCRPIVFKGAVIIEMILRQIGK